MNEGFNLFLGHSFTVPLQRQEQPRGLGVELGRSNLRLVFVGGLQRPPHFYPAVEVLANLLWNLDTPIVHTASGMKKNCRHMPLQNCSSMDKVLRSCEGLLAESPMLMRVT